MSWYERFKPERDGLSLGTTGASSCGPGAKWLLPTVHQDCAIKANLDPGQDGFFVPGTDAKPWEQNPGPAAGKHLQH